VVIDVEVRERHVRDRRPGEPQLGEAPRDATTAVDEEADVVRLVEISRATASRVQRDRSGAQRGEASRAHAGAATVSDDLRVIIDGDRLSTAGMSSMTAPRMRTLTIDDTPGSCIVTP